MKIISQKRVPAGEWFAVGKDGSETRGPMGESITTLYECPCGKGTVRASFENIPGYRESFVSINCDECKKLYDADYNWARHDEPVLTKKNDAT